MRIQTGTAKRFVFLAMLAPLVAACSTTTTPGNNTAPAARSLPSFPPLVRNTVDPALANPCITAAANRYYIPERVITAVDSRASGGGNTDVILKVDSRDTRCTISSKGTVRSIVDFSPMSADQKAANEAAAAAKAAPAPAKQAKKKS